MNGSNDNESEPARLTVEASTGVLRALDALAARHHGTMTRDQAGTMALEEWARAHGASAHGGKGLKPEDLNASNDD